MAMIWLFSVMSFSSRRRHTRCLSDWSSDVCSSDLPPGSFGGGRGSAEQNAGEQNAEGAVDARELAKGHCAAPVRLLPAEALFLALGFFAFVLVPYRRRACPHMKRASALSLAS